ncbi:hypothetical protein HPB48_004714 [Haemaphysalis longicornis]|uniref:Laminin G domain-containing protein n=1 Tax=Haemaphysalis longicornis TaxID=44386 RepID=A0A9J6G153_HAELO|nr:hypothetical protein HPB48_004714 [Haemaphysalis longicornis]
MPRYQLPPRYTLTREQKEHVWAVSVFARWQTPRLPLRVSLTGCQPKHLQLDGQSFVLMDLNRRPVTSTEETLQLRFRTNHEDGLLLYSRGSQHDLLALQLVHACFDDNAWHDVQISRLGREFVFTVDSVVVRQMIKGDFFRLDLNREASSSLGFYM